MKLLSFLDSLEEPKQQINLEDEIVDYWKATEWSKSISLGKFKVIARYFYGLGQSSTIEEPIQDIDYEQELYNHFGQVKDFTLGMRIAKYFYELGHKEESVCEGLGDEIDRYLASEEFQLAKRAGECNVAIARHFAQWQKEKDTCDLIMSDSRNLIKCYEQGKKDMKEQMMKEAVEGQKYMLELNASLPPVIYESLKDTKLIIIKEEQV